MRVSSNRDEASKDALAGLFKSRHWRGVGGQDAAHREGLDPEHEPRRGEDQEGIEPGGRGKARRGRVSVCSPLGGSGRAGSGRGARVRGTPREEVVAPPALTPNPSPGGRGAFIGPGREGAAVPAGSTLPAGGSGRAGRGRVSVCPPLGRLGPGRGAGCGARGGRFLRRVCAPCGGLGPGRGAVLEESALPHRGARAGRGISLSNSHYWGI